MPAKEQETEGQFEESTEISEHTIKMNQESTSNDATESIKDKIIDESLNQEGELGDTICDDATNDEGTESSGIKSNNESDEENLNDTAKDSDEANETSILDDDDNKNIELNTSTSTTPKKHLSAKQLQKKLESEKKRMEKQKERDEKDKERQRLKEEKDRLKLEKDEQKLKEKIEKQKEKELKDEQKRKEREEKEQKRKEKDEKEEQKRKEREQEKIKRQMEVDEKNKEKQKAEEQKQKSAAVLANFFVAKKPVKDEKKQEPVTSSIFMPFEVKSDMRLAPLIRRDINQKDKENLINELEIQDVTKSYIKDLKEGKPISHGDNTWPVEEDDDVILIDIDLGESITEHQQEKKKMRVKFLYFHENRRPPYFGTWRKRSNLIVPRKPFSLDKQFLNYEIDSDDEWEEEDPGESIRGSDDEDKENDSGNEYEVDNDFFVPHGHLSEDELDDEENAVFSPESHKVKLKLLKNEFDEEMKLKTQKIKPRLIGCIWYDKNHTIEDAAIDKYLKPFTILHNNDIVIRKRTDTTVDVKSRKSYFNLDKEHIRDFIKLIDGNKRNRKAIVEEYHKILQDKSITVSKTYLIKLFKKMVQSNSRKNALNWCISDEYKEQYSI